MKDWLEEGSIKSVQHQEFIYSYYFLVTCLWRYALYSEHKITQSEIKQLLNYNPNDKRLNYIIKKGGLLDTKGYTFASNDYPIYWHQKDKQDVYFTMLNDLDEDYQGYVSKFISSNVLVKEPLKHTVGDGTNDGIFWNTSNTHMMRGNVFETCMLSGIGCPGFYIYGILSFIRDKSGGNSFPCTNETLSKYTGWSLRRVQTTTNKLQEVGLLTKSQSKKAKGNVNFYTLL